MTITLPYTVWRVEMYDFDPKTGIWNRQTINGYKRVDRRTDRD